jgi:hypothetical protein
MKVVVYFILLLISAMHFIALILKLNGISANSLFVERSPAKGG